MGGDIMLNQEPPKNNPLAYKSSALGERCTGAYADNGRLNAYCSKMKIWQPAAVQSQRLPYLYRYTCYVSIVFI